MICFNQQDARLQGEAQAPNVFSNLKFNYVPCEDDQASDDESTCLGAQELYENLKKTRYSLSVLVSHKQIDMKNSTEQL